MIKKKVWIIVLCSFFSTVLFSTNKIVNYESIRPINLQRNWFCHEVRTHIGLINKFSYQNDLVYFFKKNKNIINLDIECALFYQSIYLMHKSLIKIIDNYDKQLLYWKTMSTKPVSYWFYRGPFRWFEDRSVKNEINNYIDILQEHRNKYAELLFKVSCALSKVRLLICSDESNEKVLQELSVLINKTIFNKAENSPVILKDFLEFIICYEKKELKKIHQHGLPSHLQRNLSLYLMSGISFCVLTTYILRNKKKVPIIVDSFNKRITYFYSQAASKINEVKNILTGKKIEKKDVFLQHCQRAKIDAKNKVDDIVRRLYPDMTDQELKGKRKAIWDLVYIKNEKSILDYNDFTMPLDKYNEKIFAILETMEKQEKSSFNFAEKVPERIDVDESSNSNSIGYYVKGKWVLDGIVDHLGERAKNEVFNNETVIARLKEERNKIILVLDEVLNDLVNGQKSQLAALIKKYKLLYEAFTYIHISKVMNLLLSFKETADKTYEENRLTLLLISSIPVAVVGWGLYRCCKKIYLWGCSKEKLYKNIRFVLCEITNILLDSSSKKLTDKDHGLLLYFFDKLQGYSEKLGIYDFENDLKSLLSSDNKLNRINAMYHRYSFLKI